jgi:predicted transcriptional regulator
MVTHQIQIAGVYRVSIRDFGQLEAVVMDRVWNRSEVATVRDIFDELAEGRQIAYTTVLSTMDNLHRKGWLARERVGKAYRYWPVMTREKHSAELMRSAFASGGDADLVLTFFLEQMSEQESTELQTALGRLRKDVDNR